MVMDYAPCPRDGLAEALGVLYRRVPDALRHRLVLDAINESDAGLLDLDGLWVARGRAGRVVGAMLTQLLAGSAAAVWPPEVDAIWGRGTVAAELVRCALAGLRAQDVRIAQALVDPNFPGRGARDLIRGGLPRITALTYLQRDTTSPIPPRRGAPDFDWQPFGPATESEFRDVLQATYQGSLDMPELEGVRSLDDVLDAHRASGRFSPDRWRLGRLPTAPDAAAVLLVSDVPDRGVWEVAYLGLTPPARGRGLGRAALSHALTLARDHVPRLELAVDDRNHPARHLYRRAGFTPFDRREVHLALLQRP